ncbi:MAG TPA: ABC transporter permease, partial [Anaeromyxobacteraceae bacterium]
GFSSDRLVLFTFAVSGGLAGLAGIIEVAGPVGVLQPGISPGYGFTAIIVAFVGRLHPLGCVLGSVLLSMILIGGELAQSRVGLPPAVSGVFQGVLLLSLLGCDTLIHYRPRWSSSP